MNTVTGTTQVTGIMEGDVLTANIRATLPLVQFLKKGTDDCTPNFVTQPDTRPILYPVAESQNEAKRLPVKLGSDRWFYNSETTPIGFDASSGVSVSPSSIAGKFKRTSVDMEEYKIPALQIIGNIASGANRDSDTFSFEGVVEIGGTEQTFRSSLPFRIEEVEGDPYMGFITVNEGGSIDNNTSKLTLKGELRKGGVLVTENISYKWQELKGDDWVNIPGANKKTLDRFANDIDSRALIQCVMTSGGVETKAQITISDETDPKIIHWGADGAMILRKAAPQNRVKLTPRVVFRGSGLPDPSFANKPFSFKTFDAKGEAFNLATAPTSTSVTVTYDDQKKANMLVQIHATVSK